MQDLTRITVIVESRGDPEDMEQEVRAEFELSMPNTVSANLSQNGQPLAVLTVHKAADGSWVTGYGDERKQAQYYLTDTVCHALEQHGKVALELLTKYGLS